MVIKTENLTKRFKKLVAVDNVSLEVEAGECFGLLGPNGAGKTSLIRMLTAVSPPSGGQIWVLGRELKAHTREIKGLLGVVPQIDNLDPDLSVLQNLLVFARYFDIPGQEAKRRAMEVLKLFELEGKKDSDIRELSGGMKRRLLLARGLINQPRIWILDEPTIGLDPQAKYLVWHKLGELKSQGVTELLCTQNMEEAEALCDRIAIMHMGKILSLDTPNNLIAKHVGSEVWEIELDSQKKDEAIAELKGSGLDFDDAGRRIHVFRLQPEALSRLQSRFGDRLRRRSSTLEDVFLRLTGRSLVE